MLSINEINPKIQTATFSTRVGAQEVFLTIAPDLGRDFTDETDTLQCLYDEALAALGLSDDTQAFARLYISDIENQKPFLEKSGIFKRLGNGAFSVVEQRPIKGGRVVLLAYHIKPPKGAYRRKHIHHSNPAGRNGIVISGDHYKMVWTGNYAGKGAFDSGAQTREIFNALVSVVEENNMTLRDNMVRTWIFVRDIDNHYRGMVSARRNLFAEKGLTEKTRFVASTGIEGKMWNIDCLVSMDSLFFGNLKEGQIVRMEALENLSPTIQYGVTFERGLKMLFGDRTRFYISGTASINSKGELLFPGDVARQTERTLENIQALLTPHHASFTDMAYLIVYLRDPKDEARVLEVFHRFVPQNLPYLVVQAPVCRPGWLVEIDGVGIKPAQHNFPVFL